MGSAYDTWSERPRRPPAEYALRLARKRAWQDVERCFIATVADAEEAAPLLELDVELAHALVLVLTRLPQADRRAFAEAFYARRRPDRRRSPPPAAERAAAVAALVLPLTGRPDLEDVRVGDLLTALEQGDDLDVTPETSLTAVRKAVARARVDLALEDQLDPQAAASLAVLEVLDPPGDVPALQEVLLRATWAVLQRRGADGALEFLLASTRLAPPARPFPLWSDGPECLRGAVRERRSQHDDERHPSTATSCSPARHGTVTPPRRVARASWRASKRSSSSRLWLSRATAGTARTRTARQCVASAGSPSASAIGASFRNTAATTAAATANAVPIRNAAR